MLQLSRHVCVRLMQNNIKPTLKKDGSRFSILKGNGETVTDILIKKTYQQKLQSQIKMLYIAALIKTRKKNCTLKKTFPIYNIVSHYSLLTNKTVSHFLN